MVSMNTIASDEANIITGTSVKKSKLKPCCVCKETKRERDDWLVYFNFRF